MPAKHNKTKQTLPVEGREVPVSNLDKVLYPGNGFTKGQVIDYYIRVSQYLLPHFHNRPVTLKRYPDGVGGEFFYEKDEPSFAPDWIETFPVPRRAGGPDIQYILINNLATLIWCANAASLELHPFLHCVPEIQRPTSMVFDLDPGEGADVLTCIEVAHYLRELLSGLHLQCFPKVSGSKGIQLYVPLNGDVSYDATRSFAQAAAELLATEHPQLIVAEMAKSERSRKVFIDWSQNADFKTTVGVYSLRAKQNRPFVSLPVTWDELDRALATHKAGPLYFNPEAALTRLGEVGDLFAPVLTMKQSLPAAVTSRGAGISLQRRLQRPSPEKSPPLLREYARKRDFTKTAEPPAVPRASKQGSKRRFVVQKHAASHLHYDFRLEMHNVLKSWAVPKGVPYEQGQRRLAMATEDHPIEYLDFEGVIPKGQYGGGTVMVWDIGTYELIEGNYYKGELQIDLRGKKLKGEWHLTKDRGPDKKNWYLIKTGESMKPPGAKREDTSAVSGKTMEEIGAANERQWHSNRGLPGLDLDSLPRSEMKFIEPMLAKIAADLPQGSDWRYEIKFDGYRALGIKDKGAVRLLSRRNRPLGDKFPEVVAALTEVEDGVMLDGEIVALDAQGHPSFNLLQHHKDKSSAIVFYVFDILAWRGRDLRGLPLDQRRKVLAAAVAYAPESLRISEVLDGAPQNLIAAVKHQGLEGIIAKRGASLYERGERSGNWVKYKVNAGQELVIGGYRPGKNHFDNLAAGYYDAGGRLIFIAKIKNGFTPDVKKQVAERFRGLESVKCPFDNLPEPKNARRGEALTAEAMKNYRWLKPELVAEIGFTEWTAADHLRHSFFIGLRDDKDPKEVRKET